MKWVSTIGLSLLVMFLVSGCGSSSDSDSNESEIEHNLHNFFDHSMDMIVDGNITLHDGSVYGFYSERKSGGEEIYNGIETYVVEHDISYKDLNTGDVLLSEVMKHYYEEDHHYIVHTSFEEYAADGTLNESFTCTRTNELEPAPESVTHGDSGDDAILECTNGYTQERTWTFKVEGDHGVFKASGTTYDTSGELFSSNQVEYFIDESGIPYFLKESGSDVTGFSYSISKTPVILKTE